PTRDGRIEYSGPESRQLIERGVFHGPRCCRSVGRDPYVPLAGTTRISGAARGAVRGRRSAGAPGSGTANAPPEARTGFDPPATSTSRPSLAVDGIRTVVGWFVEVHRTATSSLPRRSSTRVVADVGWLSR